MSPPPNVIPATDRASAPLSGSIREFLSRFSSTQLITIVALALCIASGIALYAPGWWLAGLFAFSIGAAALAGAADKQIDVLCEREPSHRVRIIGPLRALRGFASAVATLSIIAFLLIDVALVLGSPGAGG